MPLSQQSNTPMCKSANIKFTNTPTVAITTPKEGWLKDMLEVENPETKQPYHTCVNYNTICADCMAGDMNMKLNCKHVGGSTNAWRSAEKTSLWTATISKKSILQETRGVAMASDSLFNPVDVKNFTSRRSDINLFKEADYAMVFIDPGAGKSETAMCIASYGRGTCSILWIDSKITVNLPDFTDFILSNLNQFREKYDPMIKKPLYIVCESNLGSYADHVYLETVNMPLVRCFRDPERDKWGLNKDNVLTRMYVFNLSRMMSDGTIMFDRNFGTANTSFVPDEIAGELGTQLNRVNNEHGHISGKGNSEYNDDLAIIAQMAATCQHYIRTTCPSEYDAFIDWVAANKERNGSYVKPTYTMYPSCGSAASLIDREIEVRKIQTRKTAKF